MTGVEKLTQYIMDEANAEIKDIIFQTKEKMNSAEQETGLAIEHETKKIMESAKKLGEERKKRMIAVYGLELRKEVLKVKREILDEAYRKALEGLSAMKRDEYQSVIEKLILKVLITGNETVVISNNEKYIDSGFIDGINKKLETAGKNGSLVLCREKAEFSGGFILKEGGLIIDCSFEMILKEFRDSTETEVARILFK